jgi:transcriptional regulator with XRE-family HTH domain
MNIPCSLGDYLRNRRKEKGLPLRKVAAMLDLDPSTLGKIEKNSRKAGEEMIPRLAEIFSIQPEELYTLYYCDQIVTSIGGLSYASRILEAAKEKIGTQKKQEP